MNIEFELVEIWLDCKYFYFLKVRELRFDSSRSFDLDDVLLIFGQLGLMAYNIFTVIAGYYTLDHDEDGALVLLSALAALFQVDTIIFKVLISNSIIITFALRLNNKRPLPKHYSFWTHPVGTLFHQTNNKENPVVKL